MSKIYERSEIFERIVQGDREAFGEWIMSVRSRIIRRVRGKIGACRGAYDMDDIFSSACRRLLVRCPRSWIRPADSDDSIEAYVTKTILHLARDANRAERARRRHRAAFGHLHQQNTNPIDELVRIQAAEYFEFLRSRLSTVEKEMIELWMRGLSHKEIAAMQSVPMKTHYTCWRRLRRQVEAMITEIVDSPVMGANRAA